ncbi:MAG: methyltransferase domain-containing protein [Bacteroidota bacterium]
MSRPDFSTRSMEPEIMDDLEASRGDAVFQTLRELATVNRLLGGNYITINGLKTLTRGWDRNRTLKIADLGCGGGDMLIKMHRWAKRKGLKVELVGVDFNADITTFAKLNTTDYENISYQTLDVFSREFAQQRFDIVVCSLFLHHFTDLELSAFLSQLTQQTNLGIIINDLHRHPLAFYSIKALTRAFSKSAMVKYDAPLSVLRAFSAGEWKEILREASIDEFRMRWRWAFRWEIIIKGAQD